MGGGRTAVILHIMIGHLQIRSPFTEHMPHRFGAAAVQVGEDGVGEVDLRVIAGDHTGVVTLLEGGVESFDELLISHILLRFLEYLFAGAADAAFVAAALIIR